MAIIDTSKGVRPVVEELAALENGNVFNKQSNLLPTQLLKNCPDYNAWKNGYTGHGVTYKYEGCGTFSTIGTYDNWNGNIFFSIPITIPIPDSYYIEETDTSYKFTFGVFFDGRGINRGSAEDFAYRQISFKIVIPQVNGSFTEMSYSTATTNQAPTTISRGVYTINKESITEENMPLFEETFLRNFFIVYPRTSAMSPAGRETDTLHSLKMYPLLDYMDYESLKKLWSLPIIERYPYLYNKTSILQQINIDSVTDILYTLSNETLEIDNSDLVLKRAPVTNIYTLAPEGE